MKRALLATTTIAVALCAAPAHAARIVGVVDYSASFSSPSTAVSFMAGADGGSALSLGTVLGASPTYSHLITSTTNYPSAIGARAELDVTAGPGSSVTAVFTEAWSGVVRVTNSGRSAATFTLATWQFYSLATFGPTNATLSGLSRIERFDPSIQSWASMGATLNNLQTNESTNACNPACVGSITYEIAADSTLDVRLFARVRGSASEEADAAVPEPGAWTLFSTGLGALGFLRRFRRR